MLLWAQNRMVPQFQLLIGVTPTNARVVWARIAATTVPTKLEAMTARRFGSISTAMMRKSGSPLTRAACTKSRLRSDIVCARSTRAPQAQPVIASTPAISTTSGSSNCEATMMMSGRPGITRKTLVRAESASLLPPETYPAVTPTTTAMKRREDAGEEARRP